MSERRDILITISANAQNAYQEFKKADKEISDLTDKIHKMEDAGKTNTKEYNELWKTMEALTDKSVRYQRTLSDLEVSLSGSIDTYKMVDSAIKQTSGSQAEYQQQTADLIKIRSELNTNDIYYQQNLERLNQKLEENAQWLADMENSNKKAVTTMQDYSAQIKESFDSINIFNGGLSGFISRAEEAGGTGPLLKNAFNGISQGIGGMTKSAITFIATPLGAIIAALALPVMAIISYFKDTEEGMDALTAVTRPLEAIMGALMDVFAKAGGILVGLFTKPTETIKKLGTAIKENITNRITGLIELIPELGKAMALLFKGEFSKAGEIAANAVGKAALGVNNIAGKTAGFFADAWNNGKKMDELQKKLDKGLADYTRKNSEYSAQLHDQNRIANDTSKTFAQREAASVQALETQRKQNQLVKERLDDEIELFKLKKKNNSADNAQLAEMEAKRRETVTRQMDGETDLANRTRDLRKQSYEHSKQQNEKKKENTLKNLKEELKAYEEQNEGIAKSLDEQLKFEEEKAVKSIKILKEELLQKKITQEQHDNQVKKTNIQRDANILKLTSGFGEAMLKIHKLQNTSLIKEGEELTDEIIKQEKDRLAETQQLELDQLRKSHGMTKEILSKNDIENEEDALYYAAKLEMIKEHNSQVKALDDQVDAAKKEKKQKDAEAEVKALELKKELAATETERLEAEEDIKAKKAVIRLEELKAANLITQTEYDKHIRELDAETARNKQRIAIQGMQTQLSTMQSVASALTEAFGQSKELALAQATMSAGQAILSIWAGTVTGNPVIDAIIKSALTASTVAKTSKQIKEIRSSKKPQEPKFEKGGLVTVGGRLHSQGGTLFTGEDGTRFEAEAGEIIGVMNRNAARHFMAFNNAFPAGGGGQNYFASGGIVSREVAKQGINLDELATKIAQANTSIPAPVVAVQDIIAQSSSYVKVRQGANF